MRGGAQAHLLETGDGEFYVVKFQDNPQHRRILVNELVASSLMDYLQIATPRGALVSVSSEFLAENPQVYIELGNRRAPVTPGWHFGSRFPGHPDRLAVYDFFPDALIREVANRDHFVGTLVFDKWTGNADARQAIYYRARIGEWQPGGATTKAGFVASMIDHGFLFNGPNWGFPDGPLHGLALRPVVYEDVTSLDSFQPWLGQVVSFPEKAVDRARRLVPPEWIEGDEAAFETMLEKLLARRRRVPDLLDACRRARPSLFPRWR